MFVNKSEAKVAVKTNVVSGAEAGQSDVRTLGLVEKWHTVDIRPRQRALRWGGVLSRTEG